MDGAGSSLRDREAGRRVSLRPPGRSGIISIHQRSKVRHRDSLVFDIMLLQFVIVSESSDIFTRSCALRKTVRMGQHVWLLLATIGTELLVIIKWSKGQFPTPLPTHVWFAWLVGAAMLVLYPVGQVGSQPTTILVYRRFIGRLTRGSCSTCSLAYPVPGDICGGILASQKSRLSNRALGLLNDSLFVMRCPIISLMCTFYICTSLIMSPAYGAWRCMTINFETTWLRCVALPNVPRSLSVILTQALTGVREREVPILLTYHFGPT